MKLGPRRNYHKERAALRHYANLREPSDSLRFKHYYEDPDTGKYANDMFRLNLVKNINFGLDQKKIFLTYWKTVFWVTEHFCIKWTFWKNAFFCPKNAFFWQKWQFHPLDHPGPRRCQGTFFSGGNFTPIFEAKK